MLLDSWFVSLIVATILGTLAGLGIGGGSLLMLWLTLVLDIPYETARLTNLLFFLPGAAVATYMRAKEKAISPKRIWPSMVVGCLAAAAAGFAGSYIELSLLKKLFGVFLLVVGVRELLYRPRNAK